jgi:hypothetical protein
MGFQDHIWQNIATYGLKIPYMAFIDVFEIYVLTPITVYQGYLCASQIIATTAKFSVFS